MANSIFKYAIKIIKNPLKAWEKAWEFILRIFYIKGIYYYFIQWNYKSVVKRISKKDKIKVAFLLIHDSVWKYEGVYRLMMQTELFEPVVVVCPYIAFDEETMLRTMDQAYKTFSSKGYNVLKTYNDSTKEWLDVREEIKPDIVFFTNPHPLTKSEYYVGNFLKALTCYVPYTFQTTHSYQTMYNRDFQNLLWKVYYPTEIHRRIAIRYATNKGRNVVVTGYPVIDRFLNKGSSIKFQTTIKSKKKIIWAPHHTIEGAGQNLNFSNFLRYHRFMIELAIKYKDRVFITFKPHPRLRPLLNIKEDWGVHKTNEYYNYWEESSFCGLNDSDYQVLFEESDAMIHDCDSFMGEYLSLNKPVLYTRHDSDVEDRLNDFGKSAIEMHYQTDNEEGIINFINEIVLNERDTMKDRRTDWINYNLIPPNSRTASENILFDLKKSLNRD